MKDIMIYIDESLLDRIEAYKEVTGFNTRNSAIISLIARGLKEE